MKRPLYTFLVFTFFSFTAHAQLTSCTQTLRLARSIYDQGRLHEIPDLLANCLRSGFSQQERVEAYKLLCLSYIYLEEPAKADDAMLRMLRTDHYFEIKPASDPAELVALYRRFRTAPIYRIGGKMGANVSQPNVKESVEANGGESKYQYNLSIQAYITAEIPLTEKLTLNPSLGYIQRLFEYENTFTEGDSSFTTLLTEEQRWLSLPVSVQYQVTRLKFKPYVSLGIQADYLLGADITGSRDRTGYQFIQEQKFNFTPLREKLNLSLIAAAGARFKLGGGFIIGEIQYTHGLSRLSSKESAFKNSEVAFKYGYADSIFSLSSVSVSVGYVYNIFNPKKMSQ